ncbi:MAG: hypothetical protein ABEJ87_00015 [Candidatus Nanohalobium sp.]
MDLEQDYIIYALQASLTFISVSAAYFIDLARPLTLVFLLPVTVLFGYTTYISRERFRPHSAIALLSLIFIPLGGVTAAVAVILTIGNFLISIFAGGESFKDYYSSSALPLLFTGLVLGTSVFGIAVTDAKMANEIRDGAAQISGRQAEILIHSSNMLQSQKKKQMKVVNLTSDTVFRNTKGSVLGYMGRNSSISPAAYRKLEDAFSHANRTVKSKIEKLNAEKINDKTVDISARISDLINSTLEGKAFLLLVPIVAFALYSLHPVIGVLTAIWASLFAAVDVRISGETDSKELDSSSDV